MADVLCPTCGKPNPEALEICQYCGTLLKQTRTEPLEPLLPGEFPTKRATSDLERTLPGWLREARRASKESNTTPIQPPQVPKEPQPAQPATPPPAAPPEPPKKKAPASPLDFLAGLSQAGEEEEETPDWLKSIQGSMPPPQAPSAPEQPAAEQPADWLANLGGPEKPAEQPASPESWGFGGQPAEFHFDESEEPAPQPAEEAPDWLKALQSQGDLAQTPPSAETAQEFPTGTEFAASGDLPDWLSSLGEPGGIATPPQPESRPVEPQPAPSEETPDWLAGLSGAGFAVPAQESEAAEPEEALPIDSGDLPSWLSDLGEKPQAAAPQPEPAAEQPSAADLPDWMAELGGPPAPAVEPPTPAESIAPAAELPDWMAGLQETLAAPTETPAPVESAPAQPGELPGWLAEAMGEQPAEKPTPPVEKPKSTSKPFSTGALKEYGSLGKTGELPDFMSGVGAPSTPGAAAAPSPAEPAPAEKGEIPDWLTSMAAGSAAAFAGTAAKAEGETETAKPAGPEPVSSEAPAGQPEAIPSIPPAVEPQNIDSILSMDMPDWLSGFAPAEAEQRPTQEAGPDSDLRPAELPSWVQAMRPVESMISEAPETGEEEGEEVEKEGPLAGFRNVLPAQPGLLETRKPKAYSIKLQVDNTQQSQAALLEQLLQSESKPKGIEKREQTLVLRNLRWIIAAVLLLAVLVPALLGSQSFPGPALPSNPQDPFNTFFETANQLPNGAPVLLVVDYQPGFSGEMEPASAPVIRQLMSKNARLAFLSTSPVGTYLAERLVQKFSATYPYQPGSQYVNLGYLPGGAAGIQAFASNPRDTVGVDSSLGNLWQTDVLNDVSSLSGFAAIFVLTDDPDTGRLWIEQTGEALAGKPMLMVVSMQAGPMLRPYAESRQLTGLVTGIEGGIMYEQKMSLTDGDVRQYYWDGFGAGAIAAEVLLLFGGAWAIFINLRARREAIGEDEA
jgi:hypothetical protein